jgi:hypothetical protein
VLTPFIFKQGTPVKVVFRDRRLGKPTDVFAVPLAELSEEQRERSPLLESELDFSAPQEPILAAATAGDRQAYSRALELLRELAANVARSPRARQNLAGWRRRVEVRTPAGSFMLQIDDGKLAVDDGGSANADFVMVCKKSRLLVDWLSFKEALTNAIIVGGLWISLNREFTTIFKLDRLPRSVRRDLG